MQTAGWAIFPDPPCARLHGRISITSRHLVVHLQDMAVSHEALLLPDLAAVGRGPWNCFWWM